MIFFERQAIGRLVRLTGKMNGNVMIMTVTIIGLEQCHRSVGVVVSTPAAIPVDVTI